MLFLGSQDADSRAGKRGQDDENRQSDQDHENRQSGQPHSPKFSCLEKDARALKFSHLWNLGWRGGVLISVVNNKNNNVKTGWISYHIFYSCYRIIPFLLPLVLSMIPEPMITPTTRVSQMQKCLD
jgi:hypothetical protein